MRIKAEEKLGSRQTIRTTNYVYGFMGKVLMEESSTDKDSDITYTSYIYAFGKTFAKVDGIVEPENLSELEITYFHYDNVGSTRLMTDQNGKVVMEQDYLPFGGDLPNPYQDEIFNEIGVEYKFTGQKEVVSIGLYYYGARYYDPSIGRFITEDTYPGELVNLQSQNLYVYVINNPLKYTDPTGNSPLDNVEFNTKGGGTSSSNNNSSSSSSTSNNTQIETPNVEIPVLDYTGPYNEEIRQELEKISTPDVVKVVDLASQTLNKEEFNLFINHIFDRGGIVTPPDLEYGAGKALQLKGLGLQFELTIGDWTVGVELISFLTRDPFTGDETDFNKINLVEMYLYGGAGFSVASVK